MPQAQAHRQFVAQISAGVLEGGQRFALLPLGPADRDAHVGVAPVGARHALRRRRQPGGGDRRFRNR